MILHTGDRKTLGYVADMLPAATKNIRINTEIKVNNWFYEQTCNYWIVCCRVSL